MTLTLGDVEIGLPTRSTPSSRPPPRPLRGGLRRGTGRTFLGGVGVDPSRVDQDGDTALFGHDAVVGVPVGVLPARGGEDGPEQTREVGGVEIGQPIVGAGELGGAIKADPGPSRAPSEGQRGPAPQVSELHRPHR